MQTSQFAGTKIAYGFFLQTLQTSCKPNTKMFFNEISTEISFQIVCNKISTEIFLIFFQ
jgi:hypothetical protein